MRKRIQQLASGKFDYTGPNLSLSTTKIELEVLEGKDESGDFSIISTNHVKMRGIIYSSNPRMECLTPQFEGEEVRIRYQFHSEGLVEGDIQKGDFFIVCNQGEYNLSFVVSISKFYVKASTGKIKNVTDFTKLARESFDEAYRLFYSQNFPNIIKEKDIQNCLLYDGLRKELPSGQRVEEFLIASGNKMPVQLELEQNEACFYGVEDSRKEQLEIKKNQWGYVSVSVTSDAEFLIPGKSQIGTEDFLGSTCFLDYYIEESRLHAGRNYGKLLLEYENGQLEFVVTVSKAEKRDTKPLSVHRELEEGRIRLMQLYMDYRLQKIVTGEWAKRSIEILDHFMAIEPKNELYGLMKAQALLINRQRQEASWILEEFKREYVERTTPIWGYYLYLCTLMEREESYVDRLTAQIEEIFKLHPKSSLLFWVLLFTREEYYQNSARRLRALEQWISKGNDSPYLYLEAYYLIGQDPYLLTKLDRFEIKILNWAAKQNAISKDVAQQMIHVIPKQKEFSRRIYQILCVCYKVLDSDEMLAAICAYLIRGQRFGSEYHKWYELGIEHEIRITNLYEAFLVSMDPVKVGPVPKMIQMYFQYQNQLPYRQLAVLFVNIISEKENQPEVYARYRRTIEQFAMTQIEAGHIDDNLAVIYEEMLKPGILNEELAEKLSEIMFTRKLICSDANIVKAVILQHELKQRQTVPVSNGVAYFKVFSSDYSILLIDQKGNCFARKELYREETLLHPKKYFKQCFALAPRNLPYLMYYFSEREEYPEISEKWELFFSVLLQSAEVNDLCKARLLPEAVSFYEHRAEENRVEPYLKYIDFGRITAESRRNLTELFVEMHFFDQAYEIVRQYGYDYLGSAEKVSLCSYEITKSGFEEDDFLLGFAESTFITGKFNDVILIYLCKFSQGSTKFMGKIWKAAGEFEIDTFDLEERIITQMLYSTDYIDCIDRIYESYYNGGGREVICMAYLSYFSNCYLVNDMIVPEQIFEQIEERFALRQELNDALKLGLLKYYAGSETISKQQKKYADELLAEYTGRNIYFAFYKQFDEEISMKYRLYDKYFVEYHTKPGKRVILHYNLGDDTYHDEEMTEEYDGIFVKEFVLLFGDTVQYYVSEENDAGKLVVMESNQMTKQDLCGEENGSRYALLNEILLQAALQETEGLKRSMKEYHGMQIATEQIFHLL